VAQGGVVGEVMDWIIANKDAFLALAAIISAVVAFVAVIVGPRTQRWIAK
jgi:hypothetical protein